MHKFPGQSIYITDYMENPVPLADIKSAGGIVVFMSLHISEEFSNQYCKQVEELCEILYSAKIKIIADVSKKTLEQFETNDILVLARKLHIGAIRIDYGFSIEEMQKISLELPIVINASVLNKNNLNELIISDSQKILAMHNFYPRPETGLDEKYFLEQNAMFVSKNIPVIAFIPGDERLRGPLNEGLPTLEKHRNIAPGAAFADMVLHYNIENVFIGDPGLSEFEEKIIKRICDDGVIMLPAFLTEDYEYLYNKVFTSREDSPDRLIRIKESREYSCKGKDIKKQSNTIRKRGTITIDNELYKRYSGEIQILKKELPPDNRVNNIGYISSRHLELMDMIKRGTQFCLIPYKELKEES